MKLSILIPARNEEFLSRTVEDILENKRGETEVIVGLDGQWAEPGIKQHEDVKVVYYPESIGQRAMTNRLASLSNAKYVMKLDAHCAFDEGFDVKLMQDMKDNWTVAPTMKNLHVFDWVCTKCGQRLYQGPEPDRCRNETCNFDADGNDDESTFKKEIVWRAKPSPNSTSYRFNKELEFKYFGEYKKRQKGDIVDTMSLQGSCFMCTREKYWELGLCDEDWGSWGGQGAEVALKTWLSGGEVKVNKKTWYAHLFRTQPGFSHPYPNPGKEQQKAKDNLRDTFLNDRWDKAVHPLSWLVEKFSPVPDWETNKGIIFYTDNQLNLKIAHKVQNQLRKIGLPIVSASIKPMTFGDNVQVPFERGYLTMFIQILMALHKSDAEIVYFCEHDVLYHPSHFDFIPPKKDVVYYNTNVYKTDGEKSYRVDDMRQTSGLVAYRDTLIKHYEQRLKRIEKNGFSRKMGFEPGTHKRKERVDDLKSETFESKFPNVDIRHGNNLTETKWSPDDFKNKKYAKGFIEVTEIPEWGKVEEII